MAATTRATAFAAAALLAATATPTRAASLTLANIFGDDMVLQSAPSAARVWGWTQPGAIVTTSFNGSRLQAPPADANGLWVQALPPTPASLTPFSLGFSSSAGGSAALDRVLFGEVIVASGQSNLVFAVSQAFGGAEAIAGAGAFPGLRLFTVEHRTAPAPLPQLVGVMQPWAVASPEAVKFDGKNFTAFSAVAWFAGAALYSSLGRAVPVGIIVSAYSGTPLQYWVSPDAAAGCPATPPSRPGGNYSQLWNGMLAPLTVGPLTLSPKSFAWWYQGEDNLGQAPYYTCALPAFIADLRSKFSLPRSSAFVVVGLSAWPSSGDHYDNLPDMRAAQVAALGNATAGTVAYAASYDQGDLASPWPGHPRKKAPVGARVAAAALGAGWGWSTPYLGPTYAAASAARTPDGGSVTVTVQFDAASVGHAPIVLDTTVACPPPALVPAATCEGLAVQSSDGAWHVDEALALGRTPDGLGLKLTLPLAAGLTVTATRGMYANWPRAYINNTYGFPAVPWNAPLGPAAAAAADKR